MLGLKFLGRFRELGLLAMRVGLGLIFLVHGSGKMFGGPEAWTQIGGAMSLLGVGFAPTFWGFMAAFAEFGGGVFFILGFLFRPAAIMLTFTMLVATNVHISKGDAFGVYSHALTLAVVFFGLSFIGPGKLSIDGE